MGVSAMQVSFHGVRGSTPCHGPLTAKYGGNTSCVSIAIDGQRPLLLDLGTGLRYFGMAFTASTDAPLDAVALVTHLHWDHIQGLPFFSPIIRDGARLELYGPRQEDGSSFMRAVSNAIRQPTFPVELHDLRGKFEFHDVENSDFMIGDVQVKSRLVPHNGPTVGYRIEFGGKSIAYISDHQQPLDGSFTVSDGVRELAEDVDLLIHDSQYTPEEFAEKAHWGHCTYDFAVHVATTCRARQLALYHHDPDRTDAELDKVLSCASSPGLSVFVAQEGATLRV
jgi:phosphoribosyl 1,2-cyclic phosphodiesterase